MQTIKHQLLKKSIPTNGCQDILQIGCKWELLVSPPWPWVIPANNIQYPSRPLLLLMHAIQIEDVPGYVPDENRHDSRDNNLNFRTYWQTCRECLETIGHPQSGKKKMDHDANLLNLMVVAARNSLLFNLSKCEIKKLSITFYWCQFTNTYIKSDLAIMQGILEIPVPNEIPTLQTFLGKDNCLQPFMLHMSHHIATPRALLQKQTTFNWNEPLNRNFQTVKILISRAISRQLADFDCKKTSIT